MNGNHLLKQQNKGVGRDVLERLCKGNINQKVHIKPFKESALVVRRDKTGSLVETAITEEGQDHCQGPTLYEKELMAKVKAVKRP